DVFLSLRIISPAAKAGAPGIKAGGVERRFPCPRDGAPEKTGVPAVANRVRTSRLVTATDLRIFFQTLQSIHLRLGQVQLIHESRACFKRWRLACVAWTGASSEGLR